MAADQPDSDHGSTIAHPTRKFEVIGHELKLSRRWSRSSSLGDKPIFSNSVHGRAVNESDHVRVFGTGHRSKELDLSVNSDLHIAESWESIKGIDLLVENLGGERRRIRDLQYGVFEGSPPTATLFYHEAHWSMECEIPSAVLDRLSVDLLVSHVDTIRLRIEWPFGLIDKETGDWGFYPGSQLRGYISSITWLPASKDGGS